MVIVFIYAFLQGDWNGYEHNLWKQHDYSGTSESGFLKFEKWKVKIKSFHSFSRSAKWKKMLSLFFEKCKVKSKCFHSFSRSEKWNQNASRSRSRSEISREFLTILEKRDFLTDLFRESQIRLLKQMACSRGINHEHLICPTINMLCSLFNILLQDNVSLS